MPVLAFGLKPGKPSAGPAKPTQKRKAAFDDEEEEVIEGEDAFSNLQKPASKSFKMVGKSNAMAGPPQKPPKASLPQTTNLSALRSAKLQDAAASQLDSTVYDYDAVYDSLQTAKAKPAANDDPDKPKYMTSLLKSAEVRKRDQLRAKEKLLQKERENEGDEFADKEAFVTSAYKKQQEEARQLEEAEKKREEEEEKRRAKGGGMADYHRWLLSKEEQRMKELEKAMQDVKQRRERGEDQDVKVSEDEDDEHKEAAELNQQGAKIVLNDEGEVVDKRQLLGAGLNVAPKKKVESSTTSRKAADDKSKDWQRSQKAQDARLSQRERQSRMMERQIEEMEEKQRQAEEAEKKALDEKTKSKVTDEVKMSAKERFLQRKKEREEEAKKAKSGG